MTLYHNSPRTGLAARCRAKEACPFGTTHGTTIRRDGTVEIGNGSPTWTSMPKPPRRREERIVIGEDGKAILTYEKPNRMPEPDENTVEKTVQKQSAKKVAKDEPSTNTTADQSPELDNIRKSIGDTTELLLQRYSIREFGDMKKEDAEKLISEVVEDANLMAAAEIGKHNRSAKKKGKPTIDTNQQAYDESDLRHIWSLVSGKDNNLAETMRTHIAQKYYRPGDSVRNGKRQRPSDIGQSQQPIRTASKNTEPTEDQKQRTAGENTIGKYFSTEKFYNLSEGNAKTIAARIAGKAVQDTVGKTPMPKEHIVKAQAAVERNIMKAWRHNNS